MRSTNIADLCNHLSRYLKEVRAGEEIVVHDSPATLRQDHSTCDYGRGWGLRLVAAGLMRKAERNLPASFWRVGRASVGRKAAANAVGRDRDED